MDSEVRQCHAVLPFSDRGQAHAQIFGDISLREVLVLADLSLASPQPPPGQTRAVCHF